MIDVKEVFTDDHGFAVFAVVDMVPVVFQIVGAVSQGRDGSAIEEYCFVSAFQADADGVAGAGLDGDQVAEWIGDFTPLFRAIEDVDHDDLDEYADYRRNMIDLQAHQGACDSFARMHGA